MTIRSIHKFCGLVFPFRRLLLYIFCLLLFASDSYAQFAPVVGFPGTTAIPGDSSAFVAWASGCTVYRGLRCIEVPDSGYATDGDSSSALGPAGQNGTVSLGDSGIAILTFPSPIVNGPGFDFAVFENGFDVGPPADGLAFLELGFVEVSSDGVRYVRFPCIDNVQDSSQISNAIPMDGSRLNNLAGKYVWDYGTPFDLNELIDSPGLDVNNILFVKVIDVIGSINTAIGTHDSRGYIVNDPYPTNFASSGFDLDAVGVINQKGVAGIDHVATTNVEVYPNPITDVLQIRTYQSGPSIVQITDMNGRLIISKAFNCGTELWLDCLPTGVYNAKITNQLSAFSKLIVKQ
jgi:hypothetical protein